MKTAKDNKTTAVLLALFLGGFGAHRFYLGKNGTATAMILISLTIIGIPFVLVWVWIDIFLILTDKFDEK